MNDNHPKEASMTPDGKSAGAPNWYNVPGARMPGERVPGDSKPAPVSDRSAIDYTLRSLRRDLHRGLTLICVLQMAAILLLLILLAQA